jgi:hypothetical protein
MMRIMFLRDKNNQPIGCLAFVISSLADQIVYGMSVLNPKDKFNRTIARDVAMLRMNMSERCRDVPFHAAPYTMHEVSKTLMRDLLINPRAPSRARKAAKLWLANNTTR